MESLLLQALESVEELVDTDTASDAFSSHMQRLSTRVEALVAAKGSANVRNESADTLFELASVLWVRSPCLSLCVDEAT